MTDEIGERYKLICFIIGRIVFNQSFEQLFKEAILGRCTVKRWDFDKV